MVSIYFQKKLRERSEDLKKIYGITGAIWIIKSEKLKRNLKHFIVEVTNISTIELVLCN